MVKATGVMVDLTPVITPIVGILGETGSNLNNMALLIIDMRDGVRLVQIGFTGAGSDQINLETVGADIYFALIVRAVQNIPGQR
jgi:hypothetical protein